MSDTDWPCDDEITLIKSRSEASSPWEHSRFLQDDDDEDEEVAEEGSKAGLHIEDEDTSSEDSDAEFAVHPILHSLIKSKSVYTIRRQQEARLASSKTFEMNMSSVLDSTTRRLLEENEPKVANFCPDLNVSWPEPEVSTARKSRPREASGCWSSPPNIIMDERNSDIASPDFECDRAECWSAPECGEPTDDESSGSENSEAEEELEERHLEATTSQQFAQFSRSYPLIESGDSQGSIRLPSSAGSASTPSPPRPLSPVLGLPGNQASQMVSSRSMQLRPKPSLSDLLQDPIPSYSSSYSDDEDEEEPCCWPQKQPQPQQEVWPEQEVVLRNQRNSWTDDSLPTITRTTSMQFPREFRCSPLRNSRSAYVRLSDLREVSIEQADFPESEAHCNEIRMEASGHSTNSQLDEEERSELARRTAWLERGSRVRLVENEDLGWVYEQHQQQGLRRSCTAVEFRRPGRRKLPKRPDEYGNELPSSVSMYEKVVFNQPYESYETVQSPATSLPPHQEDIRRTSRPPSSLSIKQGSENSISEMERSISLKTTPISMSTASGKGFRFRVDQYAHLQTPMSPQHVLSPPSSGRRLPAIPLVSTVLSRLPPMSIPPPPLGAKNDHTLCFIEGMSDSQMVRSGYEESFYEDDAVNGNNNSYRRQKRFFSPDDSSGVSSCTTSESLNPTHRVQSAFYPRHSDEIMLEVGDAVHVDRTCEDHWCYGTNLRTGQLGIFPSAVVCEIDIVDEICSGALPPSATKMHNDQRDTFLLTLLASIEVAHHKGNDVLVQAMNKVLSMCKNREEIIAPQTVLMEISFRGIHVIDKKKKNFFQCPSFDFFYSLQNISFCGAHPKQLKYFGFITKHPLLPRFACHVFMSNVSTQPIVEAIGRAFKRSYDEYMAFAHPTEDIYLE